MPWDAQHLKAGGGCGVSAHDHLYRGARWENLPPGPEFDQIGQFSWCCYGGDEKTMKQIK